MRPAALAAPAEDGLNPIVKRLALAFALLVGIGLPGGYFGLNYSNLIQHVETVAQVKAGAVNALATATPDLWMYQLQRMEELLLRYPVSLAGDSATVRDAAGNLLLTVGILPDAPVLVRSSPVYDSGRVVGEVEISHSYREVVFGTLVAGLLGLLLGALVYTTLLVLPLRALRRVAAALDRESAALSVSASRYRAVAETAKDAIITADGAGTIVGWNPAAERMFGYTEAEVIGQPVTLVVPQRYRDRHLDGIGRIQAGGERHVIGKSTELHGLTKAGREFPLELALSEWETPQGRFFAGIVRDITERKRAELALVRQKDLYEMLSQTNQAIVRITSREKLFPVACRIAVEHGRFRFAWIGLIDKDNARLKPVAKYGVDAGYIDQLNLFGNAASASRQGLTTQTLASGACVISNDFLNDPAMAPWHEAGRRAGVRASAKFPIRQGGAVIGAINLYAGDAEFFTEDLVATLNEIADDVSFALDNFAREAARNQLEKTLREDEARYQQMFDANPHPMWFFDVETLAFLAVNDAAVEHYGWSREEFLAMTLADIRPAEDLPALLGHLAADNEKVIRIVDSSRHRKKDGTIIDVEISSHAIDSGGRRARVVTAIDITKRKRVEAALEASEERWKFALEGAGDGVWDWNPKTDEASYSEHWKEMIGYAEHEFPNTGAAWAEHIHPDDKDRVLSTVQEYFDGNRPFYVVEFRMLCKDGSWKWILARGMLVNRDVDGNPLRMIGTHTDITERKIMEEKLRDSIAFRELLLQAMPLPIFHKDTSGRYTGCNRAFSEFLGKTENDIVGKTVYEVSPQSFAQTYQDKDLDLLDDPVGRQVYESRVMHADGTAHDVIFHKARIVDGAGRPSGIVGAIADITENKRAQQALRESEERFRGLVEQSIAGIYIIQDGTIAYVNPRFAEIRGYGSAEEMIGLDPLQLIAEKDRSTVVENNRRLLAGELPGLDYGFLALRKDGSSVDVGVHSARASYRGQPAIIGMMQDISEKKRAEEQIKRYIAQLEGAFMQSVEVATTLSEMRDPYTAGHERRVAEIAVAIGAELGFDARRQEGLRVAGYLHDIGKIIIPAEILAKPTTLTPIEYQLIKGHVQASYDVLKNVEFPWPVAEIALQHHERIDGSGYPQGLKGEAILIEAKILAVADTIEAMSSHRPYRAGLGIEKALAEIERGRGTVYDASVAEACLRLFREKGYAIPD